MTTAQERFEAKVIPEPMSGCSLWVGAMSKDGYGHFRHSGKVVHAHRVAMHLYRGFDLASAIFVLHRCDNPPCVNPDHLFLGDNLRNATDKAKKGRGRMSKRGLPFGVKPHFNRFIAQAKMLGRSYHFGVFGTIREAHAAALAGRDRLWKERG